MAKIKVIGVGGAGGNAINNMIENYDIEGVEFIAVNTDNQALQSNKAETKLQIGQEITRGLGSGGSPQIGKKAAEESVDLLHEHLAGADMVFITAGMGGGTGTGASPIIAGIAKNLGALTIAILEKPFKFEGKKRMETALKGITEIRDKVDTLVVIPNEKLFEVIDENISFLEAMKQVDDVLAQAVKSISQIITQNGTINVDFADIKSIMTNSGSALMGMGSASGDNRAEEAVKAAIHSPLLEMSINGAKGILFNIVSSKNLSMAEIKKISKMISDGVSEDANIYFGATIDNELQDDLRITVLATGFDESALLTDSSQGFSLKTEPLKVNLRTPTYSSLRKGSPAEEASSHKTSSKKDAEEEEPEEVVEDDDQEPGKWDDMENQPAFLRNRKKY